MKYRLAVKFKEQNKETIYSGKSWYRKNLVDSVNITANKIELIFERTNKLDADYLYSENCPITYQLYRAGCFYLAVMGRIPEIDDLLFECNGRAVEVDKNRLLKHWNGCQIYYTLEPQIANRCFQLEGKAFYTCMTYFLKAQLSSFPMDCYRAAWSSLNALYNCLPSNDNREKSKLSKLNSIMLKNKLPLCETFLKEHKNDIWNNIQWYNYVQWKTLDDLREELLSNTQRDKGIYEKQRAYLLALAKRTDKSDFTEVEEKTKKYISKKRADYNAQARFLVTDYGYMIRNRSFHADKPYPIFGLFEETTEDYITKVILLVIIDLLPLINM